ncbi:hypothetical protein JYU34_016949 [Plutella xylostella]|uniref:Uncharacterized protein n=1 Tax=Plutella xylostella TaxID=51655 RepID=A0ABQ7Q3V7_PLUXY|nr:hypothetical protein JYU34_016949 [Plutella xylostella]
MSLDDCDKRLALAGAAQFGVKYACANTSTRELPKRCDIPTETCHRFLDLTGPLQIGGLPNIPSSFQVKNKDFVGCISDLYIDHKFIDLNSFVADNGTIPGCPEKRAHCGSAPCYNGAECRALWDAPRCVCPEGYTGKDCAETTSPPWRFSGDGVLSFNPLLRPIQLPWLNALSLRTWQQDAFLMSIQVGQNSTVAISLKSGLLQYTYNGETMLFPTASLADGEWHRVEIKWLGTDIAVAIDYGLRNVLQPMLANKVQGQYIGKILIGGPDSTAGLLVNEMGYFEGCIQDVRVGTQQSLLNRPTVRENVRDGCESKADCALAVCPPFSKCVTSWDRTTCECEPGRAGPQCVGACALLPCGGAACVEQPGGYQCRCPPRHKLTDSGCVETTAHSCPSGWWGNEACGPCECRLSDGYHPHCDRKTGQCHCKGCIVTICACECSRSDGYHPHCDRKTGQCHCKEARLGLKFSFFGNEACGPCECRLSDGYHPHCDRKTGQCHCKENHYKPADSSVCLPCACYPAGSNNSSCDPLTGQCHCRSGVIGRACDRCAHVYAEVVPSGCEVVYDGCPRSFARGVWWPRTKFGNEAITDCPTGSSGKASRSCVKESVVPWQEPDMFNCTTATFYQLRKQLHKIETGELQVNTFVGVRLAEDLSTACANTPTLYGADVLVGEGVLLELLNHEIKQVGLNLTHSQDKDYIRNIVNSANTIVDTKYSVEWRRIHELTGHGVELLLQKFDKYISVLAENQRDTYTSPFEIATKHMVIGVDVVTAESIYGFEPSQLNQLHKNLDSESYTTERVILPDTSAFIHSPIQGPGYYGTGKVLKKKALSPTVSFPKYNNYVKNKNKFDKYSRVLLPLDLLGISDRSFQENLDTPYESRAVFSYIQYSRNSSLLMPMSMDESVSRRWGVNMTVGSAILQVALFVPQYVYTRYSDGSVRQYDEGMCFRYNRSCFICMIKG